ncbi:unnamed protein product, partial [marine sediment metagenome]
MFKGHAYLIIKIALLVCFLVLNPVFSQVKGAEKIDPESFAKMMKELSALVANFENSVKEKKIGEITEGAANLPYLTLEQYFKYGNITAQGTTFFIEKGKPEPLPVAEMTAASETFTLEKAVYSEIVNWLLNKYEEFYKEVAKTMEDIAKKMKDSPVRLDGVSVHLTLLGTGVSVTIGI